MTDAHDPQRRAREKARRRDRDKSHAYCARCLRPIYGGEYACEAGHYLGPGWEKEFRAARGVSPAHRPGGPAPRLVVLRDTTVSRSGPLDPWLNEVAAAAADLGFFERNRNAGHSIAGIPVDGAICLDGDGQTIWLYVLHDPQAARQSDAGLRAAPEIRPSIERGTVTTRLDGRLLFHGDGRDSVADEVVLEELMLFVSRLPAPPTPRGAGGGSGRAQPVDGPVESGEAILAQIRQLGELRDQGIVTEAEFEAKKTELLARL